MSKSAAVVAIMAASLAACAPKDAAKPDSANVGQAGVPAAGTPATQASFDPATHTAVIHAKDMSFDAPDSISAGMTHIHLVNDGPNLHHVQLVRLDSGKTAADLGAAMSKPGPAPAWAQFVGGPNTPNPGSSSDAIIDLKEGNYVILCMVDIPDHVPHFAKGMVRPIKVTAATGAPAPTPVADATVTLNDYAFTLSGALAAGTHTIAITNKGPQPHEMFLARYAPGKTMKDLVSWVDKPQGPPPGDAVGGVSAIANGSTNYITVNLTPGNYVLLCFIPDAKDGKIHVQHGMSKEFTVQ